MPPTAAISLIILRCLLLLAVWPSLGLAQQGLPAARPPANTQRTSAGEASSSRAPQAPSNYVLSPNDLVQVKVFQEDDMDWTVRVTKDGNVNLPVIGVINVQDKTAEQLGAVVRDRLHDGWLVHPQVNISVLEFSKRRFTILGQVERPGQIDFPDNATLNVLQAIGMAGGTSRNADPGRVYVKRKVGSKEIVLKLDTRRMARDASSPPFDILPGDTITVSQTIF